MMDIRKELVPWAIHKDKELEYHSRRYIKCGVACPQCGAEVLVDKWIVLTSYPPQRSYHCERCGWHGTA